MKAKKAKAAQRAPMKRSAARVLPEAYYRVHALWIAARAVAQHEDELCTLMHEMKRSGEVSDEVRAELSALLEGLPAEELVQESRALEKELGGKVRGRAQTTSKPMRARRSR